MNRYYTRDDLAEIESAVTFWELRDIAFRVLGRIPQPVGEVCGPLKNGGWGSFEANLANMQRHIKILTLEGKNIFSQIPLEYAMQRIKATPYYRGGEHLLEEFYLALFESGFIKVLYFMPGWQGSYGANWEHKQALRLGMQIIYL